MSPFPTTNVWSRCHQESGCNGSHKTYTIIFLSADSVFDAKRLIGRKYDDVEVQSYIKHCSFKVLNKSGKPYISVNYRGEYKGFVGRFRSLNDVLLTRTLVPQGNIFHGPLKMKETAEVYLRGNISNAIVTFPAYCNDLQ